MDSLVSNPAWATAFGSLDLVEKTGTQGVQLLVWLAMRAALSATCPRVKEVHRNHHIPISKTATGLMALEAA